MVVIFKFDILQSIFQRFFDQSHNEQVFFVLDDPFFIYFSSVFPEKSAKPCLFEDKYINDASLSSNPFFHWKSFQLIQLFHEAIANLFPIHFYRTIDG